jgi:hypothetical protein
MALPAALLEHLRIEHQRVASRIGKECACQNTAISVAVVRLADDLGEADGVVIIDGSGFPKDGRHSVGVARQYCGHLGKIANCQEGVFLVYANRQGYAFLDERLYVPEEVQDALGSDGKRAGFRRPWSLIPNRSWVWR